MMICLGPQNSFVHLSSLTLILWWFFCTTLLHIILCIYYLTIPQFCFLGRSFGYLMPSEKWVTYLLRNENYITSFSCQWHQSKYVGNCFLSFKGRVAIKMDKACLLSVKILSAGKCNVGYGVSIIPRKCASWRSVGSFPLDARSWYEEDQVRHSGGDCKMEGRKKKVSNEFKLVK